MEYEITYDYSGEYSDEYNIRETFVGSWTELQDYIKNMRRNGCYNIYAACVSDDLED